jgi:RNA polymerase sigma factor (sigma-70 family)
MNDVARVQRLEAEESDDSLMARVATRDSTAFRCLVERHRERPYRVAWRMLGDASAAEDIAQECLLRLWDQAVRWQAGQAGVSAWLTRVATNLCLDQLRRRKFSSGEEVPDRADEAPLADAIIEADERSALAAAAVAALPERQRAAIILTYYEEFSNQMAADSLDMNIKAFESLLLRARTALRSALADLKGEA